MTFSVTLNTDVFKPYVEQVLAPALKAGDNFILYNCSVHKVKSSLKPLIDKGVNVMFLPPYSSDLNPIEMSWSKMKSYLRKLAVDTKDGLNDTLASAFETFTLTDIKNWFTHDEYSL